MTIAPLIELSRCHVGRLRDWTGDFTTIDLIAASTNALNGALLARRPDHYKNWTVVGIMLMALLMGLGGGITRDILLVQVPSALTNPAYITLALAFGSGRIPAWPTQGGQLFREGLFQFMTSFSLPWYAIAGAQQGRRRRDSRCRLLVLAVVGPTAGRWHMDVSAGAAEAVRPGRVVRSDRGVDRRGLDRRHLGRRMDVAGHRHRVRGRLHGPRDRAVPRLGGAARQGAEGRLPARRWPADAREEAEGQVGSGRCTTWVSP